MSCSPTRRPWWPNCCQVLGAGRGPASPQGQGPVGRVCPGHPPNSRTPRSFHSTCSNGTWSCQQSAHCPSTCSLYGEGHVVTFDGQRFVFEGNCEYILVTVSMCQATGANVGLGAMGPASQHPFPTGWLQCQRLAAHLQDPDRERRVCEVGRHLLAGHKDPPGGEQAGDLPNCSGAPEPSHSGPLLPSAPGLHVHTMPAVSPRTGQLCSGEGSPPSLTLSPQQIPGCPGNFSQEGSRGQAPRPGELGREGEPRSAGLLPRTQAACDSCAPQGLSIVLADANYTVSGEDPGVHFRVKAGSLNLVLDVTIGSAYNLTLTWNKHMTVFIKVARTSQVPLPALWPGGVGSPCPLGT